MRRFEVISLHFTNQCNLKCPMCYRNQKEDKKNELPKKFFIDMIPYLSELTPQVALGGGEPFLFPQFIKDFSHRAKMWGLLTNVTTNGIPYIPIKALKDIEMVSVSYDRFKVNNIFQYMDRIEILSGNTKIGCNLLLDNDILKYKGTFIEFIDTLFRTKVDRIFLLYPKGFGHIPILKHADFLKYLSIKYEHLYVDDYIKSVLSNNSEQNWKTPCHYGKGIISIDEKGGVYGCSFSKEPLLKLEKPKDILKILDLNIGERYSCLKV